MKHEITYLKDYRPSPFLIDSAELQFNLAPKETIVTAKLHIQRNLAVTAKNKDLVLNGINLTLLEIKLDQKPLPANQYHLTPQNLTIPNVPDNFTLETVVVICPQKNLNCTGLYLTNNNFCTQNEPHGFRTITYFIDRPDVLTKFTTTIIADKNKYPVLLSNGNLISQKKLTNNQHQAIWQDPFPKSAYLFALVAGKFSYLEDYYITKSKRKITLRIFADKNQLKECHHAMLSLKQAMAWDEKNFALEYDLDLYQIVAINDLNFGAMENKGLNVFNSKLLLASPLTATDADFKRIAAVVAHEYFHNWTGNRVTCRNWFQLGLKEGLTTLREGLFTEDLYGKSISRIDEIKVICAKQFAEDSGPLAHPIRLKSYIAVDNFYTRTVYEKSAEVARMLSTIFGRKTFLVIMRKFLRKFDGQAVTIEDFLRIAATVAKTDLKQFMLWYDQCGTPLLRITDNFIKNKNCLLLKIKQEHPQAPQDFFIPLAVSLIQPNGTNTPTKVLTINKKEQLFTFKRLKTKPTLSLLRDFSAPIKIEYSYKENELLFLIAHDQNPVSRWEASQKLVINIVSDLSQKKRTNKHYVLPQSLVQMFKTIIRDKTIDPALAAEMLALPSESRLLEILPGRDIESLHHVREFLKTEIAHQLEKELFACYQKNYSQNTYNLKAKSIGKRSLKNICLHYLMHLNTPKVFALAKKQLTQADNLTDTLASLTSLANSACKERKKILENYYKKWRNQPNLVNKWLTINAEIKHARTLDQIKRLIHHPAFNIKNPNNVYALLRTFCENNLFNFHEASGSGYKFLTEQIITIDKFNPQVAAFLAVSLTNGHNLDKKRQRLLKQQLVKLNKTPRISANVYEIITKALSSR